MWRTCGARPSPRAARCSTPKRCCSSTTATARSANSTSRWMSACVPTAIPTSPEATSWWTARRSRAVRLDVSSATRTPSSVQSCSTVRKCCSASVSVGAISAPCRPASTARSSVCSATAVLPEPTSPWRSRCMGVVRPRSASISAIACSCASVSVNGSASRYRAASSPGSGSASATSASRSTVRRRSASCSVNSSSSARRRRARSASSSPRGRWMPTSASARRGSRSSTRMAAGSGSPPARAYASALSVIGPQRLLREVGGRRIDGREVRRLHAVADVVGGDLEAEAVLLPAEAEPRAGRQPRLEPRLVEPRRANLAGRVGDVRRQDVEAAAAPSRGRARTVTSRTASSSPKSSAIVRSSAAVS